MAQRAGFLGMKLHAGNIAVFQHGGVGHDVVAGCGGLWDNGAVVAVGEIEIRRRLPSAFKQARLAGGLDLIPAHVRDAQVALKSLDGAFEDAEAALFRRFFARRRTEPASPGRSQEGNSGADAFDQRLAHAQIVQRPHHLAEMSHAGKDDFRGSAQTCRIAHQFVGRSDRVRECS